MGFLVRRRAMVAWLAASTSLVGTAAAQLGMPTQSGVYGGVELTYLAPMFEESYGAVLGYSLPSDGYGFVDGSLDSDLQVAPRMYLGVEGEGGLGARMRWWTFDHILGYSGVADGEFGPAPINGTLRLDLDTIDMDVTQRGSFYNWDLQLAGGVRYAHVGAGTSGFGLNNGIWSEVQIDNLDPKLVFDGAGPTVALQARRPLGDSGLSLVGGGRTALVYGDADFRTPFWASGITTVDNVTLQIWEIQLGAQYEVEVADGVDAVLGVAWEAQRWDSNALGSFALHGFLTSFGLVY